MSDLLHRLLEGWRATRDAELEAAIVRIGAERARLRGPIEAPPNQLEAAWQAIAAAGDPGDVDRLLDERWPQSWVIARERVRALGPIAADPRIGLGLARIANNYTSNKSLPFHTAVAKLFEMMPFPSLVPAIEAIRIARRTPKASAIYARALANARRVLVVAADRALIEEARVPPAPALDELVAAHAADPGDLGLRSVLADLLIDAGDVRGELIVLQTAVAEGRDSYDVRRRITEIIARHGRALLGGVPADVAACRFERGFVVAATVSTSHADFASSFDRPGWATIEELALTGRDVELGPLLRRLPRLRVLGVETRNFPANDTLAPIGGPFPTVRALSLGTSPVPEALRMFPGVVVLATASPRVTDPAPLGRARRLGIRALVCTRPASVRDVLVWRAEGPPELRFSLGGRRDFEARGWVAWVPRAGDRARLAWVDAYERRDRRATDLEVLLDTFATTGIARVTVALARADRHAIEPLIAAKLAEIGRRVAQGKQLVPIEVAYEDTRPIDLTTAELDASITSA